MQRFLLGAVLLGAIALIPSTVRAQDHDHDQNHQAATKYYDRAHKDSHEWNDNEATSWNHYREDHHVKQTDFARANSKQQQAYWNWRHEHPDTH